MKRVSSPLILIGLGAWVLVILIFAIRPLPNISSTAALSASVYFPNGKLEKKPPCDKVFPVQRELSAPGPTLELMKNLITGPTWNELGQGYFTNLPKDLRINTLRIDKGLAQIDLNDTIERLTDECRLQGAVAQITQTFMQFKKVKEVDITINGLPSSSLRAR